MNEFTKEELQYFSMLMMDSITKNPDISWLKVTNNKLKSLIVNYCEHEPPDNYPKEFKWQRCHKCGQDYK